MVITREVVSEKLLTYLNHELSLEALVDWAENTFIDDVLEPEEDIDLLNEVLMILAAADTAQFPLTWEICSDLLQKLGVHIRVVAIEN